MQVNSTASYSPSYTANYGAAQQSKRLAATRVTHKPDGGEAPKASFASQAKANAELVQKVGLRLNAKA